ncbi:MAG: RHS repeat-associated core domain-containing protein [Gemmatimonadota bacterium]|nr:RHS repeat-associated core domain-containing protein [Gemmatimonadota bacterium]
MRIPPTRTNGAVTRMRYDGFGRRVRREGPSGTEQYVWDGDDLHLILDGTGAVKAKLTCYPGIDAPHSLQIGFERYHYALDHAGNVIGLFDDDGNVAGRYRYDPWGRPQGAALDSVYNPLRFQAREWDEETGLYYVRARYYDPDTGRFLSPDPIGLEGGINPYVFAGNDPVHLRDPSGLSMQDDYCDGPKEQGLVWHDLGLIGVWTWETTAGECPAIDTGGGPDQIGTPLPTSRALPPRPRTKPGKPRSSPSGGSQGDGPSQQAASCYHDNRFSSLFGDGAARRITEAVEIGSLISISTDAIAIARKGGRTYFGTKNPYASGFNMAGKSFVRAIGRPNLIAGVDAIGKRLTPVLAVTAAFTAAYNATIDIQCRLGLIE